MGSVPYTPSEQRMLQSTPEGAWRALVLVRLMVGAVFVSEGLQKFLFPADVGAGRSGRIGFESPELVASLVGVAEVACGALVLAGHLTRPAAAVLAVVMAVALVTTKLTVFFGLVLGWAGGGPRTLDEILRRRARAVRADAASPDDSTPNASGPSAPRLS